MRKIVILLAMLVVVWSGCDAFAAQKRKAISQQMHEKKQKIVDAKGSFAQQIITYDLPIIAKLCNQDYVSKAIVLAQKLQRTSIGIQNKKKFPLVNIILQYTLDHIFAIQEEVCKAHGLDGLELVTTAYNALRDVPELAMFEYDNGYLAIGHDTSVSNAEVNQKACSVFNEDNPAGNCCEGTAWYLAKGQWPTMGVTLLKFETTFCHRCILHDYIIP